MQSYRSARAEALVRHVTQLPSFHVWAADGADCIAPALPTSSVGVAQYLETRVKGVAAQLSSLQHAGDYTRLVVLLAELLRGEMAAGVTLRMMQGGLLDLLRASAAAVVQGEVAHYPAAAVVVPLHLTEPNHTMHPRAAVAATTMTTALNCPAGVSTISAAHVTQQGVRGCSGSAASALAAPIESLMPPLIDQAVRGTKMPPDTAADGAANAEESEMEAWENYMATVRMATTTDAAHTLPPNVSAPLPPPAAAATAAASKGIGEHATMGDAAKESDGTICIDSLPTALCALIASCTKARFVILVQRCQQLERKEVAELARTLVDITRMMSTGSKEVSEVRVAAVKGLYQLLSMYLIDKGDIDTTSNTAASLRGGRANSKGTEPNVATTVTATSPTAIFSRVQLSEILEDIMLEWSQLLATLKTRKSATNERDEAAGQSSDASQNDNDDIPDHASPATATAATATGRGGPSAELYWMLEIIHLLLQVQYRASQQLNGSIISCDGRAASHCLLPHTLIPVTLRTLSMLPSTPALSSRAVMYARLCIDVLWVASQMAPMSASRQLLYGALPEGLARSSSRGDDLNDDEQASPSVDEAAESPAVDFFLALLHQFNKTQRLVHREMRDDLVTLLALLLRFDVQFAEDALTARRAAGDANLSEEVLEEKGGTATCADAAVAAAALHACTPLSLTTSTVEAINAMVALMFETTCGAELSVDSVTNTSNHVGSRSEAAQARLAHPEEARPSALLSEDAVRSYALRFQPVSISAARRREVVEFKKYGWQLLEVHFGWQLAHLTYREFIDFHDTAAVTTPASQPPSAVALGRLKGASQQYHQRSAPVRQVTGEDTQDEAVTAALWGIQPCRLGFFDVLLLYVDMNSTAPAVVTWTREELMILEEEAWQLFTSMILFTQHLDAVAGGIRVRRHRRNDSPPALSQQGGLDVHTSNGSDHISSSHAVSNTSSVAALSGVDGDRFDDDDEPAGVLYGADMHFIAAGGVEVALRFLSAAPPEMEAVKRSALVTLAAIARTSSSGEAHLHSGSYTTKELALVHRALTQHAPALVPFLVKIIREVDMHVNEQGVPATATTLISSVAAATAATAGVTYDTRSPNVEWEGGSNYGIPRMEKALTGVHTAARWGWLPQSMSLTVVFAWCLLQCIGDVVLAEVGMVRELPDMAGNSLADGKGSGAAEDDDSGGDALETSSVSSGAPTAKNSTVDAHHSADMSLPPPAKQMTGSSVLVQDDHVGDEGQSYEAAVENYMVDNLSSSGSSMGPPPGIEDDDDAAVKGANTQGRGRGGAAPVVYTPGAITSASNFTNTNAVQPSTVSVAHSTAHRRTLLRSIHEDVLLIPELFASEGGVDLLTMWIRHSLRLCLSVGGKDSSLRSSLHRTPHGRPQRGLQTQLLRLPAEAVAELDRSSDLFLLLLDVFRAIVLGSEGNEVQFVRSGGVHGLLDLIEALALAHGLMERSAHHARILAVDTNVDVFSETEPTATRTQYSIAAGEQKEKKGVLLYAMTLLSDLLDNCPSALDEFVTWHSCHLFISPLTPEVQECWSASKGVEAVQLLLCLWAAGLPARNSNNTSSMECTSTNVGLELLRLHLRSVLRTALKEEYVCRLLHRRAKMGVLEADAIRGYYRYVHSEGTAAATSGEKEGQEVTDAAVLAYTERLLRRHRKRNAIPFEQHIALLVDDTLGLCLKVYGCLAAVGFESLHAAETESAALPSLHVDLSSLERSLLVQIAALPALCVDEVSTAMAEVAMVTNGETQEEAEAAAAWRPTTPDRKALHTAAVEAAVRASELEQIVEVGAQVQQARGAQLYHRFLVTQLRHPVAPPADGRPGAVRGAWKTQRRFSTTIGGTPATPIVAAAAAAEGMGAAGECPGDFAVELAARLSTRLAAEEKLRQQRIVSTVRQMNPVRRLESEKEGEWRADDARLMSTAPPALGSSRTPYFSLMNSAHASAAERQPASSFCVLSPPRRPAPPLAERLHKKQAMIARSVRKVPYDEAPITGSRKT